MWAFFLITWTIPSVRRGEPHEVLESFGLGGLMSLAVLVFGGMWHATSVPGLRIAGWIVQVLRNLNKADALAAIKKQVITLTDQFPLP